MHANGNSSTGINLSESNGNVIKSLSFVGNTSSNSSFKAGNISLESGNSSFDGNEVDFGNVATEQVKYLHKDNHLGKVKFDKFHLE